MCIVNFLPESHHAVLPPGICIPKLPPLTQPTSPQYPSTPSTSPISPTSPMSVPDSLEDLDTVDSAAAAVDRYLKIINENEDPLSNCGDRQQSDDDVTPTKKSAFAKLKPKMKKGSMDRTRNVIKVVLYNLANINDIAQTRVSF